MPAASRPRPISTRAGWLRRALSGLWPGLLLAALALPLRAGDIPVADRAALMRALSVAEGGETLLLAGGDYGMLKLVPGPGRRISFPAPLTIRSADPADPARFSGLGLLEAGNVVFDGLVFDYRFSAGDPSFHRPFQVDRSRNVTIRNALFDGDGARGVSATQDGFGYAIGLSVRGGSGITVERSLFRYFSVGMMLSELDDGIVRGNEIREMSTDGMNLTAVQGMLIEGNYIHDFLRSEASAAHPDMIQFWTTGTKRPSTGITIRHNLLLSGVGPWSQSIFMRNEEVDTGRAGQEMFYRRLTIEENVIINAHLHGIAVGETLGLTIRNNTILRNAGSSGKQDNPPLWTPQIRVQPGARQVRIVNNVTGGLGDAAAQPGWEVSGNLVVQDLTRLRPGHYDTVFSSFDPLDPSAIVPKPGGPLDGTGIGAPPVRQSLRTAR